MPAASALSFPALKGRRLPRIQIKATRLFMVTKLLNHFDEPNDIRIEFHQFLRRDPIFRMRDQLIALQFTVETRINSCRLITTVFT